MQCSAISNSPPRHGIVDTTPPRAVCYNITVSTDVALPDMNLPDSPRAFYTSVCTSYSYCIVLVFGLPFFCPSIEIHRTFAQRKSIPLLCDPLNTLRMGEPHSVLTRSPWALWPIHCCIRHLVFWVYQCSHTALDTQSLNHTHHIAVAGVKSAWSVPPIEQYQRGLPAQSTTVCVLYVALPFFDLSVCTEISSTIPTFTSLKHKQTPLLIILSFLAMLQYQQKQASFANSILLTIFRSNDSFILFHFPSSRSHFIEWIIVLNFAGCERSWHGSIPKEFRHYHLVAAMRRWCRCQHPQPTLPHSPPFICTTPLSITPPLSMVRTVLLYQPRLAMSRNDVPDLPIRDTTPPHIVVRGSTFVTGVCALHELKVSCHTSGTLIHVTTWISVPFEICSNNRRCSSNITVEATTTATCTTNDQCVEIWPNYNGQL